MKLGIMKKLIFLAISGLTLFLTVSDVSAKRLLPRLAGVKSGDKIATTRGVTAKVAFRADRKAITVVFSNLSIATKVDYTLSYSTRRTMQGASGSLSPQAEDPTSREIIFGTCSHGVCRYDSGLSNAKFTVLTTLKNGTKVSKGFKLKV